MLPLTSTLVSASRLCQKVGITDIEADEPRKIVERKKYWRVVNVLKESIRATTITKRILDLGVSLTGGEFLASGATIKKKLTKAITKDESVQFWFNTLE